MLHILHLLLAADVTIPPREDVLADTESRVDEPVAGVAGVVGVCLAHVHPVRGYLDLLRKALEQPHAVGGFPKLEGGGLPLGEIAVEVGAVPAHQAAAEGQDVGVGPVAHHDGPWLQRVEALEGEWEARLELHGVMDVEVGVRADAWLLRVPVQTRESVVVVGVHGQVHEGHPSSVGKGLGLALRAPQEDSHIAEATEAHTLERLPQLGQDCVSILHVGVHHELHA
mmetsp:Transcript_8321/g.18882  ORF Transcript_8321/g.18882 Transcript_8321/m.18882 type:complete len:226 (+) Transcript_8321:225-902(+)